MTNDELLHKWVNNTISEEELKSFKQRPEFEELTTLYRATQDFSAPKMDEDKMLNSILDQKKSPLKVAEKQSKLFSLPSLIKYAAAASILLLVGWFFLSSPSDVAFVAAKGQKIEGVLPDNSTFILNGNSSLSYNKKSWPDTRELNLKGEAFFKVEKGKKFRVKTANGFVQVLGTQFNIWSRKNVLEVSCKTGKVAVLSTDAVTIDELIPNDFLKIKGGNVLIKETISGDDKMSWISGISKFKKAKLLDVLDELENVFDINIESKNVNTNELISCAFQHRDLDLALKTVLSSLKINYKIEGKEVILTE